MPALVLSLLLALQAVVPARPDSAVLRVGTRDITVFRGALGAATVTDRAQAAGDRIAAALKEGLDSVTVRATPAGDLVLLGEHPMFLVTAEDADTVGGGKLRASGALAATALRQAVREVREAGSATAILIAIALALAATALLAAAIRLIAFGRRRLGARIDRLAAGSDRGLVLRGYSLLRPAQLASALTVAVRIAAWATGIVAGYVYLTFVLTEFPWTRPLGQALGQYLTSTLARLALDALGALPGLFTVALIFAATRLLVRFVRSLFDAIERGSLVLPGFHPDTAQATRRIVTGLLWMFALVVAYPYLPGSDSAAFKGITVLGGLLLTLGSAGVVGQAMSGLVLMYSHAFKVGDFVQIGQIQGTVVALGLLSTRVRTTKNEYVTLPNGVVVAGPVTNYSAPTEQGHHLTLYSSVTIGYDVPWRQVHELMSGAARSTEGVLADPAPFVLQRALNDWYVEYQVNAAIEASRAPELPSFYSRLHGSVQDAFWAAGVEIMSPSYFALRDGNTATIPPEQRPTGRAAAFRVDVNPS